MIKEPKANGTSISGFQECTSMIHWRKLSHSFLVWYDYVVVCTLELVLLRVLVYSWCIWELLGSSRSRDWVYWNHTICQHGTCESKLGKIKDQGRRWFSRLCLTFHRHISCTLIAPDFGDADNIDAPFAFVQPWCPTTSRARLYLFIEVSSKFGWHYKERLSLSFHSSHWKDLPPL